MIGPTAPPPAPRWLHGWAILTICLALPLVLLGAEVTTKDVGMVDPVGFYSPWNLLQEILRAQGMGYLIEHGHRMAGFLVGFSTIVLAVGLARTATQPLVRVLGWTALIAVCIQGLLGIGRVYLNAIFGRNLALFHGCFAQLVLAILISVVILTSQGWWQPVSANAQSQSIRDYAILSSVVMYIQIVLGAFVRHFQDPIAQRLHVLVSFLLTALVVMIARRINTEQRPDLGLVRTSRLLVCLLIAQITLGVEAWLRRFGSGVPIDLQTHDLGRDLARTGHFVVGAALFVTSVSVALLTCRPNAQSGLAPRLATPVIGGAA